MQKKHPFWLKFWGVRGTLPVPGPATLRYGGNTSCVEVRCGGRSFILDAGTGIRALGDSLKDERIDVFLSHTHIDHILGVPFFAPCYDASRHVRFWAGHLHPEHALSETIGAIMQPPVFPLTIWDFKARVEFNDFAAGGEFSGDWQEDGISISTYALSHPDRATGWRINYGGKSVCYITDYEHTSGTVEEGLVRFVKGADVLIYDSTYTDEEFARYKGWGHSTWQQGVRLAEAAGAGTLTVFHHDPDATDAVLDKRAEALKSLRSDAVVAREGLRLGLIES